MHPAIRDQITQCGHRHFLAVTEHGRQPALGGRDVPALATGVVLDLIAPDASHAEVAGIGAPEIPAAHRGARPHRKALRQRDAGVPFQIEQRCEHGLLGVIGAGGIAGRRPDALISLVHQVVVRQAARPARSPSAPDAPPRAAARRMLRPGDQRARTAGSRGSRRASPSPRATSFEQAMASGHRERRPHSRRYRCRAVPRNRPVRAPARPSLRVACCRSEWSTVRCSEARDASV